jgi:hypothetical protein
MKKETLNKIEELRNHINYLSTLDFETQKVIQNKLDEIIICEMNEQKIGKFNLYDFCAKDNLRPAMVGVYHKDGYKYATDAYILCKLKQDYKPELEDNIVLKDGSILPKDEYIRVPNYNGVIPYSLDDYESIKIDFAQLQQWNKEAKLHKKTYGKNSVQLVDVYRDHNFKIEYLTKVATAMKELGTDELYVHSTDRARAAVVKTEKATIILMPCAFSKRDYNGKDEIKWFTI